MKKIIKSGKKIYQKTCSRCGCEFTYENEDINFIGNVTCPECGCVLAHITTLNTPCTPYTPIPANPWYVGDSPFNYNQVTCQEFPDVATNGYVGNNKYIRINETSAKLDPTVAIQDSNKVEK